MDEVDITRLRAYYDVAWPIVSSFLMGILILVVGWLLSKWAHRAALRAAHATKIDVALARFFAALVRYSVLAVAAIAGRGKLGVETTSLVAVFASAGLAVGLALQGSLSNFASGVLILFFRPITIEDRVTIAGETGRVVDIGMFTTKLQTLDNHTIIVPNSSVTSGNIKNYSTLGRQRGNIAIGVAYGVNIDEVLGILAKAAARAELVLQEPEAAVAFVGFGASSLDFMVLAWSKPEDYVPMLHNVRKAIYEDLGAANIEIPFQQIVIHKAAAST